MGTSAAEASESRSPKQSNISPTRQGPPVGVSSTVSHKLDGPTNAPVAKPLAPPPRPGPPQQGNNTPDFFAATVGGSLSLEPNPFEQSFGVGGGPETPGGTKLPSVAALTSPSSLLPGSSATPFNWGGGSLRTGPLSPAMLSGPANDYFSDTHHLRGSFPTPNESSLRSGLTPGGSGSMFPAPSPNTQALFAQLANGGATPGTIDFHRTALSAATKREQNNLAQRSLPPQQQPQQQPQPPSVTSQPQDMPRNPPVIKPEPKPATGPYDPHDNDAANGLFMLAQGRNSSQPSSQYPPTSAAPGHGHPAHPAHQTHQTQPAHPAHPSLSAAHPSHTAPAVSSHNTNMSPPMPTAKAELSRDVSEGSVFSDESDQTKPQTRGKVKKSSSINTGRRKADETSAKGPPSKRSRGMAGSSSITADDDQSEYEQFEQMMEDKPGESSGSKSKMTDEEKRKNFLERNRVAALKCRQRKKQWLANLQSKVELFSSENDALTAQITQLREEVVNLKTLLLAHKDCPVTQQQGLHGAFMSTVVEPFNPQLNPYGMAGTMPNQQQVMAGQGVQRRFS